MREHSEAWPKHFSYNQRSSDPGLDYHQELGAQQRENTKLLQSQQAFCTEFMELRVRTEFKELIKAAQALKADISAVNSSSSSQARDRSPPALKPATRPSPLPHSSELADYNAEEEDEWPYPPPWPEPEEELNKSIGSFKLEDHGATNWLQDVLKGQLNSPFNPSTPMSWNTQLYTTIPDKPSQPRTTLDPLQLPRPSEQSSHLRSIQHQVPAPRDKAWHLPAWPCRPAVPVKVESCPPPLAHPTYNQPPVSEHIYRGPKPTIPKFSHLDPSEFARLRIALENLLPPDGTELFKCQILVDHLKLNEARLIADAYLNSATPYTDTMPALHEKFGQPHQLALRKIASI